MPYAVVTAGLIAGAAAAVISHPADVLLTRTCSYPLATLDAVTECVLTTGPLDQWRYLRSLGVKGAYSGLGPRLMMISAMTSLQFTLYEGVRCRLGVNKAQPPSTDLSGAASR